MTPKVKAEELANRMKRSMMPHLMDGIDAKNCALICVDAILETSNDVYFSDSQIKYWEDVKREINLL